MAGIMMLGMVRCMSSIACCMLRVACCLSHVCMLPPEQSVSACPHAQTHLSVWPWPMQRSGEKPLSHCARTLFWSQHYYSVGRRGCGTPIVVQQCRLAATTVRGRRHREGAAGGIDGGAPGRLVHRAAASLQGTPQRRRWALAARHAALRLLCVACEHLLASAAPDPLFGSTLFVCLFACLLVCLFACDWPLQDTPSMARPTLHVRHRAVDGLFAACCAGMRACTGALPPTPPSRCRTSALHQCVCVEYPRRRVLCCQRVERPLATRSRTSARP